MLHIFGDEHIITETSDLVYSYCAVAFDQSRFNTHLGSIRRLVAGGPSLLTPLTDTLREVHGFALVCHSRIHKDLLSPGEVWNTNDIPEMSPTDFVWSVSTILTIAYLIRDLLDRKWRFNTADVFYDPKSLSQEHRAAMEVVLQDRLRRHVAQFIRNTHHAGMAKVRHVKAIEKPKSGVPRDKLQLGTWLADGIVRRSERFSSRNIEGLIGKRDITQDVNATLSDLLK